MSDIEMLKQWKSNVEKQLEEKTEQLQELEKTKESEVKRYLYYAALIRHWLTNDVNVLNENIKENLNYELEFLESHPKKIAKEILDLENSIEHHTFVISKLSELVK